MATKKPGKRKPRVAAEPKESPYDEAVRRLGLSEELAGLWAQFVRSVKK